MVGPARNHLPIHGESVTSSVGGAQIAVSGTTLCLSSVGRKGGGQRTCAEDVKMCFTQQTTGKTDAGR
jgi:hypothetical protein